MRWVALVAGAAPEAVGLPGRREAGEAARRWVWLSVCESGRQSARPD